MLTTESRAVRVLGELVLIFVGVSLGLLADSYRERRAEARATRDALVLLYEDLLNDSADFVGVDGVLSGHVRATSWLQRNWSQQTIDFDSLGWALRDYLYSPITSFRRSAYTSLSDQNRLALIEPDSLRRAIVAYYDDTQAVLGNGMEDVWEEKKRTVDAFSPYFLRPPGRDHGRAWPMASGPATVTAPWSTIRENNIAYNQASFLGVVAQISGSYLARAVQENADLRSALRAEIRIR